MNISDNEQVNNAELKVDLKTPMGKIYYPWLSVFFSIICIYIIASNLGIKLPFSSYINNFLFDKTHLSALLISLALVYVLEILIFNRHYRKIQTNFQFLNNQISQSWKQKNKQQLRANTYSDHTNKLKSFINDRLIEFMDFDEKFIHFKGIAAEVRHNGVISYDKVSTALNRAVEQQKFLAIYEQEDEQNTNEEVNHTNNSLYDYQSAKDAIAYLWDLLDLSTAENMSLYIGKKLIDYEESYFQTQLNSNQHNDTYQTIGYHPTFHPIQALLMSLQLFTESDTVRELLTNGRINSSLFTKDFNFENDQFLISTEEVNEILGNPNHIVLLLENLIKNAQFFNHRARFKQKSDRIVINLHTTTANNQFDDTSNNSNLEECISFSIYNRGSNIASEHLENIFKLGYTTRKKKDANGRGLGLYFVKEIINGYQGTIEANNIYNKEQTFELVLKLANSDKFTYQIKSLMLNERVLSYFIDSNNHTQTEPTNDLKIEHTSSITSIKITNTTTERFFSLDEKLLTHDSTQSWTDNTSQLPRWKISLTPFKKKQILTFKALDITGVRFDVNIPSVLE